jgi:hypothetical protein
MFHFWRIFSSMPRRSGARRRWGAEIGAVEELDRSANELYLEASAMLWELGSSY